MADNIGVKDATGATVTVLSDEVTDGTLGTGIIQYVKLIDGTIGGTTKAAVGANGLASDVKAVIPGVAATNLGKAEDAAHTTGDTGVMALAVRKDTAAALAGADGDYIPLIVDASGRLWVMLPANSGVDIGDVDVTSVIAGTGATNLGKAEDAVHGSGDTGVMMLGVRKDTAAALAGTDGDYQPLIMDASGRLHIAPIPASENLVGLIGSSDIQVAVTPTCDTSAYTAGDVIFDVTAIANAGRVSGGVCVLQSVTVVDKADQTAAAMTLFFFSTTGTFGTANAAPSMSDANAGSNYQGHVVIAAADWVDIGGAKIACAKGIGLAMKPAATTLYVAATTAGTPTYGASDLVYQFTFLRS